MDNLIFLVIGFALGVVQARFWPQPWTWVWEKISGLWATKPPAVS